MPSQFSRQSARDASIVGNFLLPEFDISFTRNMYAVPGAYMWQTFSDAITPFVLVACLLIQFGCSSMKNSDPNRVLQSMAVSPATADAQNFPQGQVQFTATGIFSMPPSPAQVPFVDPYSGSWMSSDTNIATIDHSGVATCVSGASGRVTITAIASSNSAKPPAMSTAVTGTAQLTCP